MEWKSTNQNKSKKCSLSAKLLSKWVPPDIVNQFAKAFSVRMLRKFGKIFGICADKNARHLSAHSGNISNTLEQKRRKRRRNRKRRNKKREREQQEADIKQALELCSGEDLHGYTIAKPWVLHHLNLDSIQFSDCVHRWRRRRKKEKRKKNADN